MTVLALRPNGHPWLLDRAFAVHHCAGYKLDRLPLCIWRPRRGAAAYCNSTHVRLYQRLFLRDHPCSVHGRNAPFCEKDARCKWCTGAVRCVESDVDCSMHSNSTRALLHRVEGLDFGLQQAWSDSPEAKYLRQKKAMQRARQRRKQLQKEQRERAAQKQKQKKGARGENGS